MKTEFISSDYSDSDGDGSALQTRPLQWRSKKVNDFFTQLDEAATKNKSSQAKQQTKGRVMSYQPSIREAPSGPAWALQNMHSNI